MRGNEGEGTPDTPLFCSPPRYARKGSGLAGHRKANLPREAKDGKWSWLDVGEEGSAEAFTKATPDQRVCLEWPTKCPLSHHFSLAPDGGITCSVILSHSKSLDAHAWVVTQPIPVYAARLRHKYFIFSL